MAKAQVIYNIAMAIDIPNTNKAQWTTVGVIVKTDNGKLFGKINYRPMKEWDGKFCIFPVATGGGGANKGGAGEFPEPLEEEPAF
jgi:hypothetical protein